VFFTEYLTGSGAIVLDDAGLKIWIRRSLPIPKLCEESPNFSASIFTSFLSSTLRSAGKANSDAVPEVKASICCRTEDMMCNLYKGFRKR